jgi:hypothetical protein
MTTICPKCHYARQERDADVHPGVCPACGIAYIKWVEAQQAVQQVVSDSPLVADAATDVDGNVEAFFVPVETFWQRFHYYTCFMPSDGHIAAFWAHLALYIVFLGWGAAFIWHGIDWLQINSSFLHAVDLPFHEYGHVMFRPFGTFWMFLGGSLFQILLPLFPLFYFMVWQRDNFAASMMLWWCGQNFIDVSAYIADAPFRAIPLINDNDNSHDWWNLLSMSGALDSADSYATLCFALGVGVILLSNVWGGYLLSIEFRGRSQAAQALATDPAQ